MNMKLLLSLTLILMGALLKAAPSTETKIRVTEDFNMGWKFLLGDSPERREINYDDSQWRTLNLPHDWSIEGDYTPDFPAGKNNGFFPEGLGWYRKTFTVAKEDLNKQFVIQFDGVFMNSEVWINGCYLGRRPYGYSTFRYDLTDKLKVGGENVIAVRVDNSNPGADRWYHGSGIYRNVHLIKTNYVHFRHNGGIYITTPIAEKHTATIKANYEIMGTFFDKNEIKLFKKNRWLREENKWKNAPRKHDCIIRTIIYDHKGKEVARTENNHVIENYETNYKATQTVTFNNPNLWSDKTPYLYTVKSEIEYNGKLLDDAVTEIGIRKIDFVPGAGLFVNGVETKLKGVCLHHEAGSLGAAVPRKVWIYRLSKLKEMGCNALRTSHNPFEPAFYEVCDSMGFYVMDEAFDEWTTGWNVNWTENPTGKAMNGYNHLYNEWWRTDLADMIKRDRNHPSVIIWGVGNEIPDYRHYKHAGETIAPMLALCKELDPTRPSCVGDNNCKLTDKNGVTEQLPIMGFNYIERDFGSKDMYRPMHEKDPEKLCFGSEVNKELCYHIAMRDNPYVIGGFIWTGIDYLGETKELGRRGWNSSLLDLTLNKKYEGALYEACWTEEPRIFITSCDVSASGPMEYTTYGQAGERVVLSKERLFSWNKREGEKTFATVYNNCDEIELKLNGKSLGRKETGKDTYYAEFEVSYKPGKLEAIGYRNGKKVGTCKLETTGSVSKIQANPVWKEMSRDGKDINIIEIRLTDDKGRTVPEAENEIIVSVTGGAKLIGIDSPNLYYTGNFKTDRRKAQNGTLLVTVQSNGKNEKTVINLSSKGIKDTTISF